MAQGSDILRIEKNQITQGLQNFLLKHLILLNTDSVYTDFTAFRKASCENFPLKA